MDAESISCITSFRFFSRSWKSPLLAMFRVGERAGGFLPVSGQMPVGLQSTSSGTISYSPLVVTESVDLMLTLSSIIVAVCLELVFFGRVRW